MNLTRKYYSFSLVRFCHRMKNKRKRQLKLFISKFSLFSCNSENGEIQTHNSEKKVSIARYKLKIQKKIEEKTQNCKTNKKVSIVRYIIKIARIVRYTNDKAQRLKHQ